MALSQAFYELSLTGLNNRYFVVRHGQSEANVIHLISSTYSTSIANHGLTAHGVTQAQQAGQVLLNIASKTYPNHAPDRSFPAQAVTLLPKKVLTDLIFYASDFKRTYETAFHLRKRVCELSHLPTDDPHPPLYTSSALRERYFGAFDGGMGAMELYQKIWDNDATTMPDSSVYGAESIQSVVDRVTDLIVELEHIWVGKTIVLVAHGDICSISLATFSALDPRLHRTLPNFENCDVRELVLINAEEQEAAAAALDQASPVQEHD